jgi:hypothetical protein
MSTERNIRRGGSSTRIPTALSEVTRRQVVQILHEDTRAVSIHDLAEQIAATSSADADSLRVRLHHNHLPKLAECGLVDWNSESGMVSTTDHPVYETERLEEPTANGDDRFTRAFLDDGLSEVLAAVRSENGPVTRESVARKLARQESDGRPPEELVEDIAVQLHHQDLPKLVESDTIGYDPSDGTVTHRSSVKPTNVLHEIASNR